MVKRCLIRVDPLNWRNGEKMPYKGWSFAGWTAAWVPCRRHCRRFQSRHSSTHCKCFSPFKAISIGNTFSTFLVVQLTYQVPCIPNPEVESEAGGSSEDKDGQDGRKKKNRWVSQNLSLIFTLFGSHPFYRVTCIVVSPVCCFTCIIFNHPGAPPARRSLAWLGSHAGMCNFSPIGLSDLYLNILQELSINSTEWS